MRSLLVLCFGLIQLFKADDILYLDEHCGHIVYVDIYIRLQASKAPNLRPDMTCSVQLVARPAITGGTGQIHARFLSIDIPVQKQGCVDAKIDISEQNKGGNFSMLTPPNGLCGNLLNGAYSYATDEAYFMTFTLTTDNYPRFGSFDVMITNFHEVDEDGECLYDWWNCGNGRCVDPSVKCNSFDNCGDNSDETYEKCKQPMYFYENCGLEIHVYDAVHLKLKRTEGNLVLSTTCENIVVASGKSQDFGQNVNVYAHFHSISLPQPEDNGECKSARIDIYNGLRNKKNITGSTGLCGTSLKTSDYSTKNDQFMPIDLKTDASAQPGKFEIILTSFHTGDCLAGEFRCKNGWCVDSTLTCDGYQNCGDNTDETDNMCDKDGLTTGDIAAIVLAVVLFFAIISIAKLIHMIKILRRKLKNQDGDNDTYEGYKQINDDCKTQSQEGDNNEHQTLLKQPANGSNTSN